MHTRISTDFSRSFPAPFWMTNTLEFANSATCTIHYAGLFVQTTGTFQPVMTANHSHFTFKNTYHPHNTLMIITLMFAIINHFACFSRL